MMNRLGRFLVFGAWIGAAASCGAAAKPAPAAKPPPGVDPARVQELAALLPAQPRGFGEPCANRAAWDALATNKAFAGVVKTAEKLLGKELPAWDDELYLDFSRTGKRPPGEHMLGHRHGRLAPLVWAECLENKGRFVPEIGKQLQEYVKEPTWTLPAHDRDLKCFHGTAYEVDLASSAVAMELAQVLYLVGGKLDADTRALVMAALEKRIFGPYRESARTGKGNWWMRGQNNWNPVCLAGVTGAAFAVLPAREERAFFAAAAERFGRNYIDGYTADGYCSEGVGYWNYGFSNFLLLREELWQATGGIVDLFRDAKVRNMALFGLNIEIVNGVYPSIADCHTGSKPSAEALWYSSRALGLGLQKQESAWDPMQPRSLSMAPMEVFPNSLRAAAAAGKAAGEIGIRSWFDQAGLLICRPPQGAAGRFGAALKGGHNDEFHNHNDVGSFSLVLGHEIMVGDPGGPNAYNNKTFGPERYTAFKLFSSHGHPVPQVAGRAQIPGRAAAAKILSADFGEACDTLSMDIAKAYDAPELQKLVRTFVYARTTDEGLGVRDDFEFSKPAAFEVALTTRAQWKQTAPDTLEFTAGGERMSAKLHASAGGFEVTSEKIDEDCPPFTRIAIKLEKPLQAGSLTVLFRPAPKGP